MMYPIAGTILMLHRTAPHNSEKILYNENLKISPEELDVIIKSLRKSGKIFLSLDEVVEIIKSRKKSRHKFVAITLDDGYKDNITFGLPVFKAHNVPFCIYATNSFPNKTSHLWWFALEALISWNHSIQLLNGNTIDNKSLGKKKKNFLKLRDDVLTAHYKDPLNYFRQLGKLEFDLELEKKNLCLTWDDLKEISNDPLATIGCHTVNHYPLSRLTAEEVQYEIGYSKNELEKKLNKPVNHFAFPFGSSREAGKREYDIARHIGFDSIVTTVHGHVHLNDDLQRLDRIFLAPMKLSSSTVEKVMYWNIKTMISLVKKSAI